LCFSPHGRPETRRAEPVAEGTVEVVEPAVIVTERNPDIMRLYELLSRLANRVGGPRRLRDQRARRDLPLRGVYYFFEPGEFRSDRDDESRVVRVGTHALKSGAKSTLWGRLSQHRGSSRSGGGNHRGSIFRLLVGSALANQSRTPLPNSWGVSSSVRGAAERLGVEPAAIKEAEADLERRVSAHIGQMPFLWLNVADAPGPESERDLIERNSIALLSGYRSRAADSPSPEWLGNSSDREPVRRSGLWNNRHVDAAYDPSFLDLMEAWIESSAK